MRLTFKKRGTASKSLHDDVPSNVEEDACSVFEALPAFTPQAGISCILLRRESQMLLVAVRRITKLHSSLTKNLEPYGESSITKLGTGFII